MRTVYSNTKNPKLVKWSIFVALVIALVCMVLYLKADDDYRFLLHFAWFLLTYSAILGGAFFLTTFTIDEEADTISSNHQKKNILKISNLKTVSYKENRKGKFRSLFIHDKGVGFIEIQTSKKNADSIVAELKRINPSIEIKHENYL